MLRLGYATYGMQEADLFAAIPRLVELGYSALELSVHTGTPADPIVLDTDGRAELRALLEAHDLPTPHLMDLSVEALATGDARTESQARFREACVFADALRIDRTPVLKMPMRGEQPTWDGNEHDIAAQFLELADIAAEHDVIFAPEPHVGTCFETPEKGHWLMTNTDHQHLGLALDISHFPATCFDVQQAVELCAPYAVTTHVKDTVVRDGEFRFRLPGVTGFDYEWYCRALLDHGYDGPIICEVSAQLWRQSDHDPWEAAAAMAEALADPIAAANASATD